MKFPFGSSYCSEKLLTLTKYVLIFTSSLFMGILSCPHFGNATEFKVKSFKIWSPFDAETRMEIKKWDYYNFDFSVKGEYVFGKEVNGKARQLGETDYALGEFDVPFIGPDKSQVIIHYVAIILANDHDPRSLRKDYWFRKTGDIMYSHQNKMTEFGPPDWQHGSRKCPLNIFTNNSPMECPDVPIVVDYRFSKLYDKISIYFIASFGMLFPLFISSKFMTRLSVGYPRAMTNIFGAIVAILSYFSFSFFASMERMVIGYLPLILPYSLYFLFGLILRVQYQEEKLNILGLRFLAISFLFLLGLFAKNQNFYLFLFFIGIIVFSYLGFIAGSVPVRYPEKIAFIYGVSASITSLFGSYFLLEDGTERDVSSFVYSLFLFTGLIIGLKFPNEGLKQGLYYLGFPAVSILAIFIFLFATVHGGEGGFFVLMIALFLMGLVFVSCLSLVFGQKSRRFFNKKSAKLKV
jgi:hypothetical protein